MACMSLVKHGGSACWLMNLRVMPWGVHLVACGWFLCMNLVSSWVKLVVKDSFCVGFRTIRTLLGIGE